MCIIQPVPPVSHPFSPSPLQLKPRRITGPVVHRQLTQAELLAEAARTEIENTRSLQYLVAIEEETKKKAALKKGRYVGPMVRLRSAAGEDGEEHTTLEVRNMQPPPYLQPQKAPPPPAQPACAVSGKPARYRDPATGLAYADLAAYREIKARTQGKGAPGAAAAAGARPGAAASATAAVAAAAQAAAAARAAQQAQMAQFMAMQAQQLQAQQQAAAAAVAAQQARPATFNQNA